MIISLGRGMQALSIAIRAMTPGHPIALYAFFINSNNQFSIPDIVCSITKWMPASQFQERAL
jgi:hypothetical protein